MSDFVIAIAGLGVAGLRTAVHLREYGFSGTIVAIDSDDLPAYDRPPLSKQLLGDFHQPLAALGYGEIGEHVDVLYSGANLTDIFSDDDGHLHLTVETHGGEQVTVDADAVVLATGSQPVAGPAGAFSLYSHADAVALRDRVSPGTDVTILGAGWIGCELASHLASHGCQVRLVERAEYPLPALGPQVGARVATWIVEAGIFLEVGVENARPDGLTVAAMGARPAVAGIRGLEGVAATARGAVLTDPHGRVLSQSHAALPGLWAVGACADVLDGPSERITVGGHWTSALRRPESVARALAATAAGGELTVPNVAAPEVFSTQFEHELMLIGEVPGGGEVIFRDETDSWTALWVDDGQLHAGLTVDRPADTIALRKALRNGPLDLGDVDLLDPLPLKRLLKP